MLTLSRSDSSAFCENHLRGGDILSVLVTGASGFIGSHLVRRLLSDGEEVHVLLRKEARAERLAGLEGITRWTADLGDTPALELCLHSVRPNLIFHCAGSSSARKSSGWEPVRDAFRTNLDGLVNLLEAACVTGAPLRSLIRLGGLEEYGNGRAPFLETQREAPRSAYSASQVAGTHLLQAIQPTLPFAAVTLRPALIYGPGQSSDFMIPALIQSLLAGSPFPLTAGRSRRDLLHIDDLVGAMIAASKSDGLAGEVINIATGVARQMRTIARAIGRIAGRMDLLRFGEVPERNNDIIDLRADASKAERLLAWRPATSLARGLSRTIEWYRDHDSRGCTA